MWAEWEGRNKSERERGHSNRIQYFDARQQKHRSAILSLCVCVANNINNNNSSSSGSSSGRHSQAGQEKKQRAKKKRKNRKHNNVKTWKQWPHHIHVSNWMVVPPMCRSWWLIYWFFWSFVFFLLWSPTPLPSVFFCYFNYFDNDRFDISLPSHTAPPPLPSHCATSSLNVESRVRGKW